MTLSLEDRLDITDLYARYNQAIDSGQAAVWAGLFTADGEFNAGQRQLKGTAALEQMVVDNAARGLTSRHYNSNLVLEATGDGATGRCYLVLMQNGGDGKPPQALASAIYSDDLVRTPDGWRFARRAVAVD